MNFKLEKIKLLVASILALIIGAFMFWGLMWKGPSPENYLWLKFKSGVTGLIITFALTYAIYSLIQKKK
jgi:hypothetical protein